ncbi:helix-turn-helix domain-containing protein [Aquabacterium sp.]|uniref:helix-turn-helix domain-containing protein n=1 Tax=Aquabacterium sp. TaxID=1872578 RepID=UPI0025C40900|nr:helix-turn-helix domain-containing protein [Aquabacterium sp.]
MELPQSVQQIADVIGSEKALLLVGKLPRCHRRDERWPNAKNGQAVMYVPKLENLSLDHKLVEILGWPDAEKLSREFGGLIMYPAKCADLARKFLHASILRMARTGIKSTAVAVAFGVSERTVRNLLRENPLEEFPAASNDNALVHNELARA